MSQDTYDYVRKTERNTEIVALRESGMTLQAIGDRYGITRERVRQILLRTAYHARKAEHQTAA